MQWGFREIGSRMTSAVSGRPADKQLDISSAGGGNELAMWSSAGVGAGG